MALDVLEVMTVNAQARFFGKKALKGGAVDFKDLRFKESTLGSHDGAQLNHLLPHRLVTADPRVLIGNHEGIRKQPAQFLLEATVRLEGIRQSRRGRRQRALKFA